MRIKVLTLHLWVLLVFCVERRKSWVVSFFPLRDIFSFSKSSSLWVLKSNMNLFQKCKYQGRNERVFSIIPEQLFSLSLMSLGQRGKDRRWVEWETMGIWQWELACGSKEHFPGHPLMKMLWTTFSLFCRQFWHLCPCALQNGNHSVFRMLSPRILP